IWFMRKFDKIFTYDYQNNSYFLFRIINYGDKLDQLKFNFVAQKSSNGIIYTKESLKVRDDNVITDYGEISYHNDGSVLWKHPRYPIKSRQIENPKKEGFRRRKLNNIDDWEPVVKYDIFDYRVCEIKKKFLNKRFFKLHRFKNKNIFTGKSFSCLINIVHSNYQIPNIRNPREVNERIPNLTENLDLWIIIKNIDRKGNYLEIENMSRPIFTTNNIVQIVEKNT